MTFDKLNSLVNRFFFIVSIILLMLAIIERGANEFGYTILRGAYNPSRMAEYAALLMIFVIALLLRQVRDRLKKDVG